MNLLAIYTVAYIMALLGLVLRLNTGTSARVCYVLIIVGILVASVTAILSM